MIRHLRMVKTRMISSRSPLKTHNRTWAVEISSNLVYPLSLQRTMGHLTMMQRTNRNPTSPNLCKQEIVGIQSCKCLSTCTHLNKICPTLFRLQWQRCMDTEDSSSNSVGILVITAPISKLHSFLQISTFLRWKYRGSIIPRRTASNKEDSPWWILTLSRS